MSKDLLAEFGDFGQATQAVSTSKQPTSYTSNSFALFDDLSSPHPEAKQGHNGPEHGQDLILDVPSDTVAPAQRNELVDNDWGDFEGAQPPAVPSSTSNTGHEPKLQKKQNLQEYIQQSRSLATAQSSGQGSSIRSHPEYQSSQRIEPLYDSVDKRRPPGIGNVPRAKDPDILFDASQELGEDDDFGEFEGGTPGPPQPADVLDIFETNSGLQGLRLDELPASPVKGSVAVAPGLVNETAKKPLKRADDVLRDPRGKATAATAVRPTPSSKTDPLATANTPEADEAWDDFTAWEAPTPPSTKSPATHPETYDLPFAIPPTKPIADPSPSDLPPTNIPPPAILLSLFPPIFTSAEKNFFIPLAAQPHAIRARILASPATTTFLQGYLALATVAARIIAGRKLRWKRDTRLAQSMKIGPASSGRSTGMKLAGVDRSEERKEERKVLDVVGTWQAQLGRLRSAVAGAKGLGGGVVVPELKEAMPVRVAKQSEGGVPAPRCCALCGLKRDERVGRVDENVDDSFGEWWVERMSMHRGCRNFWEQHKDELRQR